MLAALTVVTSVLSGVWPAVFIRHVDAGRTLTSGARDYSPSLSPNGERVAFLRSSSELCIVTLTSPASSTRCVAKAAVPGTLEAGGAIAWSPDSKWIAFMASGAKSFTNVQVMPAAGGDVKTVSFLANVFGDSLAWSPDGTFLLFNTTQRTEQGQVAR